MTNDCERCGTPTESGFAVFPDISGVDGYMCDDCRESLKEWYNREQKPSVRGGCSSCGGRVEISFRYMGDAVEVVANCPECGWTGRVGE